MAYLRRPFETQIPGSPTLTPTTPTPINPLHTFDLDRTSGLTAIQFGSSGEHQSRIDKILGESVHIFQNEISEFDNTFKDIILDRNFAVVALTTSFFQAFNDAVQEHTQEVLEQQNEDYMNKEAMRACVLGMWNCLLEELPTLVEGSLELATRYFVNSVQPDNSLGPTSCSQEVNPALYGELYNQILRCKPRVTGVLLALIHGFVASSDAIADEMFDAIRERNDSVSKSELSKCFSSAFRQAFNFSRMIHKIILPNYKSIARKEATLRRHNTLLRLATLDFQVSDMTNAELVTAGATAAIICSVVGLGIYGFFKQRYVK
eukprot:GEMP01042952.1.p1 GENE.GEMP01042952.1~~GEMP01042952.1.p1  ORF type:complete len:319 (+),score=51.88 GEMP01042952.1:78-1034(+)